MLRLRGVEQEHGIGADHAAIYEHPFLLGHRVAELQRGEEVRIAGTDSDRLDDRELIRIKPLPAVVHVQLDVVGEDHHPVVGQVGADHLQPVAELAELGRRAGRLFE